MITVSADTLLAFIKRTIEFPYPQICKHWVAGNLLDLLEREGYPLSDDLAKAVVTADDDTASGLGLPPGMK